MYRSICFLSTQRIAGKIACIRYKIMKELKDCIRELNGWQLKGVRLIVDVAKDSVARLKEGNTRFLLLI